MKGWHRLIATVGVCFTLAACNDTLSSVTNKVEHPLPTKMVNRMKAYDMSVGSPIMMRIFKEESVLEIWKARGTGRYEKIAEYDICKWSGELGPKTVEGDYQAPEGYYTVARHQMNPNSSYYLSFNLGYPNRFDRSHNRTGSNLMVHGACSSAGCYSMTDESVLEIYAFAREAFRGGQEAFQVQAYPFRMTAENMARHRDNQNFEFWKMLKVGYDHFELTKMPPKIDVCEKRYVFNQVPLDPSADFVADEACPPSQLPTSLASAYSSYQQEYQKDFAKAVRGEDGGSTLAAFFPGGNDAADAPMSRPVPTMTAATATAPVQPDAAAAAARMGAAPAAAAAIEQAAPAPDAVPVPAETTAVQPQPVAVPVPTAPPAPESASLYTPVSATAPASVETADAGNDRPLWKLWSAN